MISEHCRGCVAYQWVCGSKNCTDLIHWPSAVPENPPCFKGIGPQFEDGKRGVVLQFPGVRK